MKKYRYITRMEYERSGNGWWVRVKKESQTFNDNKYGGEAKALKEALKYRDVLIKKYDINIKLPRIPKLFHSKITRTTTGEVGIYEDYRNGRLYLTSSYYLHRYKPKTSTLSVNKHGYEKAMELAIAFRKNGLKRAKDLSKANLRH